MERIYVSIPIRARFAEHHKKAYYIIVIKRFTMPIKQPKRLTLWSACAASIWAIISDGSRLRTIPSIPVAQSASHFNRPGSRYTGTSRDDTDQTDSTFSSSQGYKDILQYYPLQIQAFLILYWNPKYLFQLPTKRRRQVAHFIKINHSLIQPERICAARYAGTPILTSCALSLRGSAIYSLWFQTATSFPVIKERI